MNSRRFIANPALEFSLSLSDLSIKVQATGCPKWVKNRLVRRSAVTFAIRSDILWSEVPTKAAFNPVQLMSFLALHAMYLTQVLGEPRFHDPSAAIGRPAETAHCFAIS
jgi:hypothetical protein